MELKKGDVTCCYGHYFMTLDSEGNSIDLQDYEVVFGCNYICDNELYVTRFNESFCKLMGFDYNKINEILMQGDSND